MCDCRCQNVVRTAVVCLLCFCLQFTPSIVEQYVIERKVQTLSLSSFITFFACGGVSVGVVFAV